MGRNDRNYLFSDGDLATTLDQQTRSIKGLVEQIPQSQFLATSAETLIENIVDRLTVSPLVLHEDQMQMEQAEVKVDVAGRFDFDDVPGGAKADGHQLRFFVPFSGDAGLWKCQPNVWSSRTPQGEIDARRNLLILSFQNTSNTAPEWYRQELDSSLQLIRQSITAQSSMLSQFHSALPDSVRKSVQHRRQEVEKLHGLASAFNIPMVKKPGMPEFTLVDVKKKTVRALPKAPAAGYKPEPAITAELYTEILSNIRHMGATFEGTPQTYLSLGEEGLRDILLASLNGVYQGAAAGEAFRKYGKTDIRIEEETRSAFVGECKLWGGEKVLVAALDQLLDYLTWRDCKAALILFNKSVSGFAGIQETISQSLPQHELFIRSSPSEQLGEWRMTFRAKEDEGREVTIHVFCFNLYVSDERAGKKR